MRRSCPFRKTLTPAETSGLTLGTFLYTAAVSARTWIWTYFVSIEPTHRFMENALTPSFPLHILADSMFSHGSTLINISYCKDAYDGVHRIRGHRYRTAIWAVPLGTIHRRSSGMRQSLPNKGPSCCNRSPCTRMQKRTLPASRRTVLATRAAGLYLADNAPVVLEIIV